LFPVAKAKKTKLSGKKLVLVGVFSVKISENDAIKAFKKL
jgi:hypothetical protein